MERQFYSLSEGWEYYIYARCIKVEIHLDWTVRAICMFSLMSAVCAAVGLQEFCLARKGWINPNKDKRFMLIGERCEQIFTKYCTSKSRSYQRLWNVLTVATMFVPPPRAFLIGVFSSGSLGVGGWGGCSGLMFRTVHIKAQRANVAALLVLDAL